MASPKKYMAGSVPRFLRQTKLSYLRLDSVIGSRVVAGDGGNFFYDIIMLPAVEFQRMRTNVGMQHVVAPALRPGGSAFTPSYVMADVCEITVPETEPDPENFARSYFLEKFDLLRLEKSAPHTIRPSKLSAFARAAYECTAR